MAEGLLRARGERSLRRRERRRRGHGGPAAGDPRDGRAWDRHLRPDEQAPRWLRRRGIRPRHHGLRRGPGGLSVFPGVAATLHCWRFDDPAAATGTEEERLAVFRRVRTDRRTDPRGAGSAPLVWTRGQLGRGLSWIGSTTVPARRARPGREGRDQDAGTRDEPPVMPARRSPRFGPCGEDSSFHGARRQPHRIAQDLQVCETVGCETSQHDVKSRQQTSGAPASSRRSPSAPVREGAGAGCRGRSISPCRADDIDEIQY